MEFVFSAGHLLRRLLRRISTLTNDCMFTSAYSLLAMFLGQVAILDEIAFVVQSINVPVVVFVVTGVISRVPVACYSMAFLK
jgi:hypothetical protein